MIPDKEKAHMRSPKLTSAILAAAALLVLATAGTAAARVHAHHHAQRNSAGKPCRVTLSVAPRLVTAGETVLASGQAACSPAEGQKVTIYQKSVGPGGYSIAAEAMTVAGGLYEAKLGPLDANTVFYATTGSVPSPHRQVRVAAQATFEGPQEGKTLFTGFAAARTNLFSGTVNPKEAGLLVVLQRENAVKGNEWHRIAATRTDANGNYSFTKRFYAPGASSLRVVVRPNRSHRFVSGFSTVKSYDISQAENPALMIFSATNPVSQGGSTVIEGTAPGLADTPLSLEARGAHSRFTTVASTSTDQNGHYAFPAQTPAVSTFYKVTGGGRTSAVLYQGVKYVLTATPSATTVTSGQPITFTGTVTPARAGHEIWIEKQNIFGTGFHPVAVGVVNADGSYSISRSFFAPGTDVLRVKIPGDPENGGAASEPVTVTVNPVPGARVPAERPGNGTLPAEGQTK